MKTSNEIPVYTQTLNLGKALSLVVEYYDNGDGVLYTNQFITPSYGVNDTNVYLGLFQNVLSVQDLRNTADQLISANAVAEQKLKRKLQRKAPKEEVKSEVTETKE